MPPVDRTAILHAITQLTRIQPQLTEAEQPVHDAIRALHDERNQQYLTGNTQHAEEQA